MMFFVMVAMKLEGRIELSWFLTFISMWILDLVLFLLLILQITAAVSAENMEVRYLKLRENSSRLVDFVENAFL